MGPDILQHNKDLDRKKYHQGSKFLVSAIASVFFKQRKLQNVESCIKIAILLYFILIIYTVYKRGTLVEYKRTKVANL